MTTPKTKTRPPEIYTREEMERILKGCGRSLTGIRNRAMIVMGWRTGLRISEVIALYPKDIDLTGGTLTVRHGKGDKYRKVGIDAQTIEVLQTWIGKRATLGLNGRQPLFCTISKNNMGHALNDRYMRLYLKRLRDKIDLDKDLRFHCLRHSFTVGMVADQIHPVHIQGALGHSSLATTTTYLRKISPNDTIDAMRSRKW